MASRVHEIGTREHAEVTRHRGPRDLEMPGDLTGGKVSVAEQAENLPPGRVGEGLIHLLCAHQASI